MISAVLILSVSVVLYVYWFRYTCLLILRNRSVQDYAGQVALANRLRFVSVQQTLRNSAPDIALEPLHRSLEEDFRVLTYLLRHGSGQGGQSLEQRMVMLDYKVMRMWYRITQRTSAQQARKALTEMSDALSYFAHHMGQRTASQS